jgi:acyl transferase domain-containing protein
MTAEIIGLAAVAPGAGSADELFRLLDEGRCTVSEIPGDRWDKARYWHPSMGMRGKTYTFAAGLLDDCYAFDPAVFGMSRPEAQLLDPQQRVILQVVWRALEDANIDHADLAEQRVGVYVGASGLDHGNLIVEDPAAAGPYFMTGNTLSIVSNRISHVFSLRGPSLTVDTACSSSLVALDLAFKALEAGEIDLAIVGGVNVLVHPLSFVGFAQARMLSPEGLCRAYDDDGKGYVRAEGGVIVVLRRSDDARYFGDRSHGRIVASAVNSAGRTNGI